MEDLEVVLEASEERLEDLEDRHPTAAWADPMEV
jgi:hypothetical protein